MTMKKWVKYVQAQGLRYAAVVLFGLIYAVLASTATAASDSAPALSSGQTYQLALEARTQRDYSSMLTLLRQAAEDGNMAAQELLGTLLMTEPALYGDALVPDRCEAAYWAQHSKAQGSPVGRHQLLVLNNHRDGKSDRTVCRGFE